MDNKNNAFDMYGSIYLPTGYGYKSSYEAIVKEGFLSLTNSNQTYEKQDKRILDNKSRELYRNSAIYTGIINKVVQYVIDRGLQFNCATSNQDFNTQIETLWYEWFDNPDITDTYNGTSLTQSLLKEYLLTGEAFLLILENGKVQLIESEQITSTDNKVGIDVDDYGKAIAYYVTPYNTSGKLDFDKTVAYPYTAIIHLRKLDRPSALRGLPLLQSAFSVVTKISEVVQNEIAAMEVLSQFAVAITRQATMGAKGTADNPTRITQINKATIVNCNPGESVQGINRNIPSPNFREALNTFLNQLATPLGLCSEIVSNDWSNSNFSQSKVAISSSYNSFRIIQDTFVKGILEPLYKYKLSKWINSGIVKVPNDMDMNTLCYHHFQGPQYPSIDLTKDTQAQINQLSNGINTYSDILNQTSKDYNDVITQRKKEIEKAIEISKEIETNTGVCIPYQTFCGLPLPNTPPITTLDDSIDEGNIDNRLNIGT